MWSTARRHHFGSREQSSLNTEPAGPLPGPWQPQEPRGMHFCTWEVTESGFSHAHIHSLREVPGLLTVYHTNYLCDLWKVPWVSVSSFLVFRRHKGNFCLPEAICLQECWSTEARESHKHQKHAPEGSPRSCLDRTPVLCFNPGLDFLMPDSPVAFILITDVIEI